LFWAIVLVVFACFAPDLRNDLLAWDDSGYITENVRIRALSSSTIYWAFTDFHCNYWAPLTWLSLALDYAIWGLNPVGYHLTNNLLHALTAGLFFLIAHRLLLRRAVTSAGPAAAPPEALLFSAALAAAFFGMHPLRVESVAWAAERKDVLSMAFGMGAVLAYLGRAAVAGSLADRRDSSQFLREPIYWLMLLLYALSLSSKAMLVTLPLVFLVLDWFPLGRLKRNGVVVIVLEKVPMLLLAVLSSLVTMRAMAVTSKTLAEIDLSTRVLVAFRATAQYLRLTILPQGISPVYFHPGNVSLEVGHGLSIAVVACITSFCLFTSRRWPGLLAAWLVYLVALSPVLGLTQNGPQEMAARFTYFPSMALSLLAAAGGSVVWSRLSLASWGRRLLPACVIMLLAGLAAVTVREIGYWKNDGTLWSRVIELQPHRFGKAYFQRSLFLNKEGRYQEALADANEALWIAARKEYAGIHENYAQIGRIRRNMGDLDRAIYFLGMAIELAGPPWREGYRLERAMLYEETGNAEQANREFDAAMPMHGSR
jgi:hypothetical protein